MWYLRILVFLFAAVISYFVYTETGPITAVVVMALLILHVIKFLIENSKTDSIFGEMGKILSELTQNKG